MVAVLAVGREGLETALFLWAATQAAARDNGSTTAPLIGAALGLAIAAAGLLCTVTPHCVSGSALARVRFQACTWWPASLRRRAMGSPIMPMPRTAIRSGVVVMALFFLGKEFKSVSVAIMCLFGAAVCHGACSAQRLAR